MKRIALAFVVSLLLSVAPGCGGDSPGEAVERFRNEAEVWRLGLLAVRADMGSGDTTVALDSLARVEIDRIGSPRLAEGNSALFSYLLLCLERERWMNEPLLDVRDGDLAATLADETTSSDYRLLAPRVVLSAGPVKDRIDAARKAGGVPVGELAARADILASAHLRLKIVPAGAGRWLTPDECRAAGLYPELTAKWDSLAEAFRMRDAPAFNGRAKEFTHYLATEFAPDRYPSKMPLICAATVNQMDPPAKASALAAFAFILCLITAFYPQRIVRVIAWFALLTAFVVGVFGIVAVAVATGALSPEARSVAFLIAAVVACVPALAFAKKIEPALIAGTAVTFVLFSLASIFKPPGYYPGVFLTAGALIGMTYIVVSTAAAVSLFSAAIRTIGSSAGSAGTGSGRAVSLMFPVGLAVFAFSVVPALVFGEPGNAIAAVLAVIVAAIAPVAGAMLGLTAKPAVTKPTLYALSAAAVVAGLYFVSTKPL